MADATEAIFTFEEVDDGFEIGSEAGTIMVRKVGEGQIALAAGSVMPMQLLDDGGIVWFEKHIPIEIFWTNLRLWKHAPEFVYFMHPVDYDRAVRRLSVAA
jgi:hypothetical protein